MLRAGTERFWAKLLSADASGLRNTFNRVLPDASCVFPGAFTNTNTLRFVLDGLAFYNAAVELNGARGIDSGTIVNLIFAGSTTSRNRSTCSTT